MNIYESKCPYCGKEKEVDTTISGVYKPVYKPCKCEIEEDERQAAIREAERNKHIESGKRIYRNMLIPASGLCGRLGRYKIEDIIGQSEAVAIAKEYAQSIICGEKAENLLLVGQVGTGKTMLAAAIVRYICENCKVSDNNAEKCYLNQLSGVYSPYFFTTAISLLSNARSEMLNNSSATVQRCKSAKLLVIDDIGTSTAATDFQQTTLLDIIDSRYNEEKPTIITTNLNAAELPKAIGQRSYDRIKDGATIITINEESHRKPKKILK